MKCRDITILVCTEEPCVYSFEQSLIFALEFNHRPHESVQAEYSSLENTVNGLYDRAREKSAQSQAAYQRGDGALAKQLSEEAKTLRAEAVEKEAEKSDYIFDQNNSSSHAKPDEIDLHGQRVNEMVTILDKQFMERRKRGMTYVHVIVGKVSTAKTTFQRSSLPSKSCATSVAIRGGWNRTKDESTLSFLPCNSRHRRQSPAMGTDSNSRQETTKGTPANSRPQAVIKQMFSLGAKRKSRSVHAVL
jgi:hypothetical protein